ncbi:LPS export ABC transporter periplasmic protein LptC [Enterobacterales bacterium CwR94]|nr:LPS export ABC transporter periplasmic protein LptC [Enterobacterales bacterium CwR94]
MSKTRRWITLILAIIAVILVGLNLTSEDDSASSNTPQDGEPTYISDQAQTVVYNPQGALNYKLVADKVEYFSEEELSWFTRPVMTTYDENKIATWSVRADKAKLTKDRMLYLYGHVEVNALTQDAQLRRIQTDNAQVNLITQDVTSDDQVKLSGTSFNATGMKMRGNLRKKTAELIEKVQTSYEIQNEQKQP